MKKVLIVILLVVACFTFNAVTANAATFYPGAEMVFGLSAIDGTGQTESFKRLNGQLDATSFYAGIYGFPPTGSTFVDSGDFFIGSLWNNTPGGLIGSVGDGNLGMLAISTSNDWELYAHWSGLTALHGYVSNVDGNNDADFQYTSGTITLTAQVRGQSAYDVAILDFLYGTGDLDYDTQKGNLNLGFSFRDGSLRDGFWLAADGTTDIADMLENQGWFDFNATTNTNTAQIAGQGTTIHATNAANADVFVPEPASMLLFGSGLFGLVGAGIKKRKLG